MKAAASVHRPPIKHAHMIDALQRIHYGIASLSFPKLLTIGITGGSTIGTFLGELMTNQWGAAGLSGVIGGTLMAVVLVVPRVMEQRRKTQESEATISSKLFEQQAKFYERRLLILNDIVRYYQIVAAQRDLIATYERSSKHDVLSQLNAAELAIREHEYQAASAGRPFHQYQPRSYADICGDNDRKVERAKDRIADAVPVATAPESPLPDEKVRLSD